MIVVYDNKFESVIPDRISLEYRITQAMDMVEYCKKKAVGDNIEYYQSQVNGLLHEIVRLSAFRDEFTKLESLEENMSCIE